MLVYFYEQKDGNHCFHTDGCGCCSESYYLNEDREKIIQELKETHKRLQEMCNLIGVEIESLK